MIEIIRKAIRKSLGNLFGLVLFQFFGKRLLLSKLDQNKILSIYFHDPSVEVFETLIKWLVKHNFEIVTLKEFQKYYDKKKCKHKRTAFISFDDAWLGNLELLDVLKKYDVSITLFAAPKSIIDGQIWLNFVRRRFMQLSEEMTDGIKVEDIKFLSFSKAFELYEAAKEKGEIQRRIMTKSQLLDFAKFACIGSHTMNHPILTNCKDDIVLNEFNESERILKNWGLTSNESLAYPNGSYNENTVTLIGKTNYKYAFTTKPKFIEFSSQKNNFEIPRICIPDGFGKYENLARMSSVWTKIFKD
ncbi:polysaccharide deacetylase family protein [Winogradskyella sp.]|uniref:polysaccharide deacetylase family protein n=1 Tax=Winogradskyella sp. TaxID=1883156 RepID=UPI0025D42567|nr:polysaccharide deacetylase family protein [Winogradskyella sp.]